MDTTFLVLTFAGLITGFSKFSVGGMGLLIVPIMMIAFPGPEALGMLLPLYLITDVMAVLSYRSKVAWSVLWHFIPLVLLGMLIGSYVLATIDPDDFVITLGVIMISMIGLSLYLEYRPATFMQTNSAAYGMGFISGLISMISNAAGPVFSLFLLEQKLDKETYVSTRTWILFMINMLKIPLFIPLGLLTQDSIISSFQGVPGLMVGAFIGYHFLKKVNPSQFKWLIRIMATLAACKLFLFS
ncbi:sulfite exporter TauE/SafE family protein [Marinomonas sp. 15G1-11]|uniref:Probable membrane transporter protein n=1 Tax=Marinomonas phaeophyticola TaxID=3004091 RepID=A0ABT4K0Z5_9GAMM|nr:sulfite exporter TauE/SafE family protein [Marinomonas sp. 15G1-11]MCZ2723693.1 sulfite exporter TauE/SafE family protein [Marinomonas sp. 15G1-11]